MHLAVNRRVKRGEGGCNSTEDSTSGWLFNIFYPKLVLKNDRILTIQMNKDLYKGKVEHDQQHPWLTTIRRFDWIQISGSQQRMTREWQYFHYTSDMYDCVQEGSEGRHTFLLATPSL